MHEHMASLSRARQLQSVVLSLRPLYRSPFNLLPSSIRHRAPTAWSVRLVCSYRPTGALCCCGVSRSTRPVCRAHSSGLQEGLPLLERAVDVRVPHARLSAMTLSTGAHGSEAGVVRRPRRLGVVDTVEAECKQAACLARAGRASPARQAPVMSSRWTAMSTSMNVLPVTVLERPPPRSTPKVLPTTAFPDSSSK